jgi:hypothetical protein
MKIDEHRRSALLSSLLKSEETHVNNLPEAGAFVSKTKDTIDKVELLTNQGVADRVQDKTGMPSVLRNERENINYIDKVELSSKKKSHSTVKVDVKPAVTITQDRINALLGAIQSETYNARLDIAVRNPIKSQLLDIVI